MQAHRITIELRYEHTPLHGALHTRDSHHHQVSASTSYHHRTGATCLHDELMNDFSNFRSYNHKLRKLESAIMIPMSRLQGHM